MPDEPPVTSAARSICGCLSGRQRGVEPRTIAARVPHRRSPLPKKAAASAAVFVPSLVVTALTGLTVGGGCAAKYSAARLEELLRGFVPVEAENLLVGLVARRRRRRLQARRRARARLHARLLPAARRRPGDVRPDRGDERAERRLRDGRHAAARALDRRVPGGAADRGARRRLRGGGRAGARGGRDPRRRAHDPRRRAEVRARRRRHGASRRHLAEERRAPGRRALPDEAARHRARARRRSGDISAGGRAG